MTYLYIFLGGGLGSICRYAISVFFKIESNSFPWATFLANLLACIILGFLMGLASQGKIDDRNKHLLMGGFCGGFSTFSTFSGETFDLIQNGHWLIAILNILLSVILCLAGIVIGNFFAERLT